MHCPEGFVKVEDALEDTSILFALSRPRNTLGHHSTAQTVTVSVNGIQYTVSQRPEYQRGGQGVTGALLWDTTPLLLTFLLINPLWSPFRPQPTSTQDGSVTGPVVLELGSGIGLAACVLGPLCSTFIATDHDTALLKLIDKNTARHCPRAQISVVQLDWSEPGSTYLPLVKQVADSIGVVLCLDCVYSSHLARMLVACLEVITDRYPNAEVVLGQQLREESLHVEFVEMLMDKFEVIRIKTSAEDDEELMRGVHDIDGFSIYRARRLAM